MNERKNLTAFTSPVGWAVFPWLSKVDTRFNPDGIYKTQLAVPEAEAASFIAFLEGELEKYRGTLDASRSKWNTAALYEPQYTYPVFEKGMSDMEKDAIRREFQPEPTGNLLFKFKLNAKVTPRDPNKEGFTQSPIIVSADTGAAITDPVFGGSIIRIKGQIAPYAAPAGKTIGLTLRMRAIQVIELVTGGTSEGGAGFWTDFSDGAE